MLVAKIILISYLWVIIAVAFLFLINARKIFCALETYEHACLKGRREFLQKFLPGCETLSSYNKKISGIINLQWSSIAEVLFSLLAVVRTFDFVKKRIKNTFED